MNLLASHPQAANAGRGSLGTRLDLSHVIPTQRTRAVALAGREQRDELHRDGGKAGLLARVGGRLRTVRILPLSLLSAV